ncbi:MAG: hypothetical protein WA941_08470 [Nitrososphaeraceae archaeon]
MTTQLQKQRSKTLDQLLDALSPDFDKLQPKVDAVLEQGKKEGFSDMEIGALIRSKMQEHYSDRTIRRVLPDIAKHTKHASKHKTQPDKMSGSEREPINLDDKDVKVEPVAGTQEEPVTAESIRKMAENILDLSPTNTQPNNKTIEQPGPKEVQGRHNIAPEEYKIEELEQYDKPSLIEIVKLLDNNNAVRVESIDKLSAVNGDLRLENTTLKKENEQYKRLPNNDALYNTIDLLKKENAELRKQFQGSNTTAGVPNEPNQKQEWLLGK